MINRVIKLLILYDFMWYFAAGLFSPIFAVFVLENIEGSTLRVIGTALTFYWVARVISTTPISRLMDKLKGERDEYYFLISGTVIIAVLPLFYLLSSQPWHIYLINFIHGLSNSLAVPGWRILFTDHLDRGKTGFEWSLEDVSVGVAIAISAYVGAFIADVYGFTTVILLMVVMGLLGAVFLIPINEQILSRSAMLRRGNYHSTLKKRVTHHPKKHSKIKFNAT